VDRGGVWLRILRQYFSCVLVLGRGIEFRHYYTSLAKSAGQDFRDGDVVPLDRFCLLLVFAALLFHLGSCPSFAFQLCNNIADVLWYA
jgi:hypothetical protein